MAQSGSKKSTELIFPVKPAEHADPDTSNIEVQLLPSAASGVPSGCASLAPGESLLLSSSTENVSAGFDWSLASDAPGFDIDSAAALFGADYSAKDFVWWDNLKTKCGSVSFVSGDDKVGKGTGTKETIRIDLQSVPANVHYVVLTASVYSKDHSMQELQDLSVTLIDNSDSSPILKYTVKDLIGRSILMACLVRKGETWEFNALSDSMPSRTISEIMHEPGNLDKVRNLSSQPRIRRKILFTPVEGKDLTPMDFSLFTNRADPYLKIFVDNEVIISEIVYANLNPKFQCPTIDFGEVSESTMKVVEIQCWDYDKRTADDNMGVCRFCIGGMVPELQAGNNKVWFKLFPTKEHEQSNTKITGHILVEVFVEEFT